MKKTLFLLLLISTLFACIDNTSELVSDSTDGVGGSYARFIIVNNFMYVIDETYIITFDVSQAAHPVEIDKQRIGERIESIFTFQGNLFIGSGFGMFIYEILDSGIPKLLSETPHFAFNDFACDPVVANASYAYLTLNTQRRIERNCTSETIEANLLKIYNVTDLNQPELLAEYDMFAPKGIGLDGTTLFVCDDKEGLKIFDVTDPLNIKSIVHFKNFTAFDVIPLNGLLLVVGPENVYEFDYTDLNNIQLLSSFAHGS
ncbi:MAG: hypothetical protein AAF738_07795 [Bacteroidota bacterium]